MATGLRADISIIVIFRDEQFRATVSAVAIRRCTDISVVAMSLDHQYAYTDFDLGHSFVT